MRNSFSVLLLLALFASSVHAQLDASITAAIAEHEAAPVPPLLERELLRTKPALELALLSADGKHVAFMTRNGLEATLQLLDTSTLETTELLKSVRLQGFGWTDAGNSLILDMGSAIGVLHPDQPASPSWVVTQGAANRYRFLGSDRTTAGGVLVARRQADGSQLLQRIDFRGATTDITTTDDYIDQALLSPDGSAAFLVTNTRAQRNIVLVRNNQATTLLTCAVVTQCNLLSYDDTTDTLWLTSHHQSDLRQLTAIAVSDMRVTNIHSDPQNTVDVFAVAFANRAPRVVQYQHGTVRNYGLDDIASAALEHITARFPASNLTTALGNDAAMWLVREDGSDLSQARYHLFDRNTGVFTAILADTRKSTLPEAAQLSRKLPLDYRGSDGVLLHGYVTLPKGVSIAGAPLVVLPHGGPWGRIFQTYDGYTQLLANRGYIVFEPNFRASTGYGIRYMTGANRDFGDGIVQQDITGGVRYLLDNGIGNPERVAIAGMSFGGFSVLSGLAFTPDLYKVGVAIVPPADMSDSLRQLMNSPRAQEQDPAAIGQLTTLLGDADDPADLEHLYQQSPRASLDTITAPVLLIAGADDDRVSIGHVKDYSLALVNLGKEVSLLIDENEGHGFQSGKAMEALYYLTELMLGEYLHGRVQPLDDPGVANYIERKLLLRAGPLQTSR